MNEIKEKSKKINFIFIIKKKNQSFPVFKFLIEIINFDFFFVGNKKTIHGKSKWMKKNHRDEFKSIDPGWFILFYFFFYPRE